EINPSAFVQTGRFVLAITHFPQDGQPFLGHAQSLVVLANTLIEIRQVQQIATEAQLVSDFAVQTEGFLKTLARRLRLSGILLGLAHPLESLCDTSFVPQAAF